MGLCVCGGSVLQCPFGAVPGTLTVLPVKKVISNMPLATIMDYQPLINIPPFGMCSNPANPQVAAATAAALGVLTPVPCIPVITAPWSPGCPTILIGGYPALNHTAKLMCSWGGMIQVLNPAVVNIQMH